MEAHLMPGFATTDAGSKALSQCLAARPGKTLFLVPDNSLRLMTVDSAIFKGGTDVNRHEWGVSKYVHDMFPDRGYLFGGTPVRAAELDDYSKIVFVALPGQRDQAVRRIKDTFAISVDDFNCSCEVVFTDQRVNACFR